MQEVSYKAPTVEEIRYEKENKVEIVVLSIFGDESYDGGKERVFVVSGVGGTQQEWNILESAWSKRIGGKPFHAADCESDRGDYKDIPHEENQKLYRDLVKILVSTKLVGYVCATDLAGHREFNPNVVKHVPYHHCFMRVIMHFAWIGFISIPQERVSFTFDINTETNFSSGLLYNSLSKDSNLRAQLLSDKISFANRTYIGIQVADLVAREFMKHCDNFYIGPRKHRVPRESFQTLDDSGKYRWEFETREYWQSYRMQFEELIKQSGISHEKYIDWLRQNKLRSDNITNKNRYLLELASKEERERKGEKAYGKTTKRNPRR